MKKYNAINITSHYDIPDSLAMFKKTITTETTKSRNPSHFDEIVDHILYEYSSTKELYRVPEGKRARIMTMAVKLPSELDSLIYKYTATKTSYEISDGHVMSVKEEDEAKSAHESGCMVKINSMVDDITNPFILGAKGSTKNDILASEPSGSNYSIKALESLPIYLKGGDILSLRSCFSFYFDLYKQGYSSPSGGGYSEYNYKREITKEEILKKSNGLCYLSILEEYDE